MQTTGGSEFEEGKPQGSPFLVRTESSMVCAYLREIKRWVVEVADLPGGEELQRNLHTILADLKNLDNSLRGCVPFEVCPRCGDQLPKKANCDPCKGRGWVTEAIYKLEKRK
jgi:hypothetical protein